MKILHVAATFPPKSYGGITSASFNLANALARRGHSITVFTTDFRDKSSRIPRAKFVGDHGAMEVQYFMNLSNRLANERIFLPIRLASATSKVLRSFDIVHLHDFRSLISIAVHRYATGSLWDEDYPSTIL